MSRVLLLSLLGISGAALVAVSAAAALDIVAAGTVSVSTITLFGATLACLVVLVGILLTQPADLTSSPHCHNCGRTVYRTLRSLDRRPLLTCFACGSEWALPSLGRSV